MTFLERDHRRALRDDIHPICWVIWMISMRRNLIGQNRNVNFLLGIAYFHLGIMNHTTEHDACSTKRRTFQTVYRALKTWHGESGTRHSA